ncbi:metallophosphoesterase [Halospeciosus flavus]|uniref:Metallophosphoesterase n=1 Tax=Halospeciosus flavus TaxID=3032283 RepID=A0ABD5Z1X1_9EURY|nr:metallophosphoesterase [Halospeciosus flavus]
MARTRVEPVPNEPAAVASLGDEDALVVADYHAGIEEALRSDGLEVGSQADTRREQLLSLVAETDADRVVFLGDLGHQFGAPEGPEREELDALVAELPVPATLVKGNHDGELDSYFADVIPTEGAVRGGVGLLHGHTWPAPEVLDADVVCVGHEHPAVRLEDEVGGARVERAWLRGPLATDPFQDHYGEHVEADAELVVCPAFNDLCGGSWVNVEGQGFLSPFLPEAIPGADAYLLDGTRLGPYRRV